MKKIILFIILLILGFFLGISLSIVCATLIPGKISLSLYLIMYLAFIISFPLTAIIHESGHLVMGLITGYKFSSFRIGKWMLIKENNHFRFKKFSLLGTGGQCLLIPPEYNENFSWFFYNFGGSLFNFLTTLICFMITFFFPIHPIFIVSLVVLAYISLVIGLLNIIPLQLGLPNDGYNIMMMIKEKDSRWCIYSQLMIGDLQVKGVKYQDMDPGLFQIPENVNLNNPLYQPILLSQVNVLHEQFKFIEAKKLIDEINQQCKLFPLLKNEYDCDYLFYLIMENPDNPKIEELYKSISKHLKKTSKLMANRQRVLYAYELLMNKNQTKAAKHLASFNKLIQSHPFQAEIECEKEIIKLIEKEVYKN